MLQETTTVLSVIHRAHLTALSATVQETTTVLSEHLRALLTALSEAVQEITTALLEVHRARITAHSEVVQAVQAALSATVPAVLTVLSATQAEADLSAVTVEAHPIMAAALSVDADKTNINKQAGKAISRCIKTKIEICETFKQIRELKRREV